MRGSVERVFTVRMWHPARHEPGAVPDWRGAVYDVRTRKTLYVVGVREITDCIATALSDRELDERDCADEF